MSEELSAGIVHRPHYIFIPIFPMSIMQELAYQIIGASGLAFIILGNLMIYRGVKIRRRYTYPLLIAGGICLEIYSIHLGDKIFIILQGVFILVSIYGLIKINEKWIRKKLR